MFTLCTTLGFTLWHLSRSAPEPENKEAEARLAETLWRARLEADALLMEIAALEVAA